MKLDNRTALAVISLIIAPHSSMGHDLWLVPPSHPTNGATVTVRAVSGMEFPKGDQAPDPSAFARRIAIGPDARELTLSPAGRDESAGLLQFVPAVPGTYVAAVETTPKLITLDADAFNEYLVTDGLPHIYRLRAREKTLDQLGKERYSKSPKAIMRVGSGGGDPCRPVGLTLEIVPLRDPHSVKAGEALHVRVLFRGQPLPDANLGWQHPGDGDMFRGTVRTDGHGEALVPVAKSGLMSIRLTHMTRPKASDYEWESFWTSLTFQVDGKP